MQTTKKRMRNITMADGCTTHFLSYHPPENVLPYQLRATHSKSGLKVEKYSEFKNPAPVTSFKRVSQGSMVDPHLKRSLSPKKNEEKFARKSTMPVDPS